MSTRTPNQPSSNLRLALYGLVLGLLPLLYPSFLSLLPLAISTRLPFSGSVAVPSSHHWSAYQRLQHDSPRAKNHDPFDLRGPEEEKLRRLGGKDAEREREKEAIRERRRVEVRAQSAGAENDLHKLLPVYFVDQGIISNSAPVAIESDFGQAIVKTGKEIAEHVVPKRVFVLTSTKSTVPHIVLSTHSTYSSKLLPTLLAHNVPAAKGHIHLPGWASYLAFPDNIDVVEIGLPLGADDFGVDKWLQLGRALRGEREESVVLAVGMGRPRKAPANYAKTLFDGLAHHTAAPREEWVLQMLAPPGAAEEGAIVPVDPRMGAYLAAVGASGELEGHHVPGVGWRFGDVPL